MRKNKSTKTVDIQSLRSINITFDLNETNRLTGYVPTRKTIDLSGQILKALLGMSNDRAFAISAPYGSGKSSSALFWCQLLEHGKAPVIKNLAETIKRKSKNTENQTLFNTWERRKVRGLALPIIGSEGKTIAETIFSSILEALNRQGKTSLNLKVKRLPKDLDGLARAFKLLTIESGTFDSILIVWDEFGKVLEQAAMQGDGKALLEIQFLAELAARSPSSAPLVLSLLLHQTFARYTNNLPSYIRNEWAKIEGRFKPISFIEDSKEIYEIISQVVSRNHGRPEQNRASFQKLAQSCHRANLFKEFDIRELAEILWAAAPLSPVALYLLPRISARVAQNERTMFSFLASGDALALPQLDLKWVGPAEIFDFFADLMRTDTTVGGAHRLWVEANSALKQAAGDLEESIVKALTCIKAGAVSSGLSGTECILSLGFGDISEGSRTKTKAALTSLVKNKSIYYRKLTGEYSVWQGTDVDIRSAVEDRKNKLVEVLDLQGSLTLGYPPPNRFPQRHNDIHCIRRYFDGRYIAVDDLDTLLADQPHSTDPILDGRIYYVVTETPEEAAQAIELSKTFTQTEIVIAVSRKPLRLRDGLSELEAYNQLLSDPDFRTQDPVVEQELRQLTDDCDAHLRSQVSQLVDASPEGPIFIWNGKIHFDVTSSGALKRLLSTVCDLNYPKTPVINNELINKSDPSPQIINARRNIIRAMLEHHGDELLGLSGYGPDVSIFRSIFIVNRLYKNNGDGWGFQSTFRSKTNPGLADVYREGIKFWTTEGRKSVEQLIGIWLGRPLGLRRGVIPILLAATFKASGARAQIFEDKTFVTLFKPETFERMLKVPNAFTVVVPKVDQEFKLFLENLVGLFSKDNLPVSSDPILRAIRSVMNWLRQLPPLARERGVASPEADKMIAALLEAKDPTHLLGSTMKELWQTESFAVAFEGIVAAKKAIDSVEEGYLKLSRDALARSLHNDSLDGLNLIFERWVQALPGIREDRYRKRYLVDRRAAGLITRVGQGYATERLLVISLAELFADKPLRFWNSDSLSLFEVNLHQTIQMIEGIADENDLEIWKLQEPQNHEGPRAGAWIERRVKRQFQNVIDRLGKQEARLFVEQVLDTME